MSLNSYLQLLVLAALWGASFLFMRTAAPEFGPIALIGFRTAIASLFLFLVLKLTRPKHMKAVFEHWRPLLVLGIANTAVPFCFFAYGTLYLEAGLTATMNSTAPMFGALIAFIWLGQSLSKMAVLGLAVGFFGVYILMSGKVSQNEFLVIPAGVSLLGSVCYGFAASYTKRYAVGISPLVMATGSQFFASLLLVIPVLLTWPNEMPSVAAWRDVTLLGVACTGVAYILYFRLLASDGVTGALSVTYLIPIFAFFWGWLWLEEVVTTVVMVGVALILVGVAMTTRKHIPKAT